MTFRFEYPPAKKSLFMWGIYGQKLVDRLFKLDGEDEFVVCMAAVEKNV